MKNLRVFLLLALLLSVIVISTTCASRAVYVKTAPPALRNETPGPKPYATAVWVGGHWNWKGGHWVWSPGYWAKPPKGKIWVAGHWKSTPRGHVWVKGHWKRR